MKELIAKNLYKTYEVKEKNGLFKPKNLRTIKAVRDVSITVPRGKIIGLLGVNGAGKTTTIRMLSAVVEPTSGTLSIDGVDAIENNMKVKDKINMIVGGERNLYWRLTAVENLEYFGSLYGLSGEPLRDTIKKLLDMVGLTDAANTPVERYSKGMKQRLQIARGLINDPDYLFLDEPTLGLDIIIAKEMRKYIKNLAVQHEKGLLLTTHYISEAEELCDYIYVIDKGEIIAQGTKEELKGILQYKQELEISVGNITTNITDELNSRLKSKDVKIFISNNQGNNIIKFIGDTSQWSDILECLSINKIQIINVKTKEPELQDILLNIIENYRRVSETI